MIRRAALILLLACALPCLTGCQSGDVEGHALVVSMGVDTPPEGGVQVCVKIPANAGPTSSSSGSSSGGSSQSQSQEDDAVKKITKKMGVSSLSSDGYIVLVSRGVDWVHAMDQLHAATPRTLSFTQVREVVLSMDAASSAQFIDLMKDVYQLQGLHTMAALVVSTSTALEFICEQKSYLGVRLSKYIDETIRNYSQKGFVPDTTLSEVRRAMLSPCWDPLLILGAVNEFKEFFEPKPGEPVDVQAGDMSRLSINRVELVGSAATDGTRVRGALTGFETQLVHLVTGDVDALVLGEGQGYAEVLKLGASRLDYRDGTLHLTVRARITPGPLSQDQPLTRRLAAETLRSELESLIARLQGLDCDALGFGAHAIKGVSTLREWERIAWKLRYREADVKVEVVLAEE